jgi:WD40 repeat protein
VRVVNIVNGNVVKALDPHDSAVLWIAYVLRSKRVISVSLDAVLHVADENNPIGFYAPLGASKPQSVVLRSLRFLPDSPSATMTETSAPAPGPSPRPQAPAAKFEVTRAIGNQELDLLALLVTGSHHGESFIQLWNFDLSHAQGTCVTPLEDEITCLSFYGSWGDIVGGTARGTVFLWAAEGTSYRCSHELTTEVEPTKQENASEDAEEGETPPSSPTISPANVQILHVLTIATESSILKDESNPETSTFLTADGAPTFKEALPTVINSESPSKPILLKRHTVRERLKCETEDGVYVVAGDENGVITTWFIVRMLDTNGKQKPTSLAQHKQPTEKDHQNTALFQHEEMAMGYEAVAALHANAQKANRRLQHKIGVCKARSRWQAHCSSIASLQVSNGDPLVVLSTNASGKVKIWNVKGDLLGVLDHFATRRMPERRPWRFPVDMEERQKQKEAFASQFFDRCSRAASKRPVTRMTILQERLSMTPQEMANERSSMCPPKSMRRRITTVVQVGDVERAIRHLALSQLRPLSTGGTSGPRSRARSIPATPPEPSLRRLHLVI